MNTTLDELHAAVLSLPEAERARLAAYRSGEIGAVAADYASQPLELGAAFVADLDHVVTRRSTTSWPFG